MSLLNATARGLRAIFTDVDTLYLDNQPSLARVHGTPPWDDGLMDPSHTQRKPF